MGGLPDEDIIKILEFDNLYSIFIDLDKTKEAVTCLFENIDNLSNCPLGIKEIIKTEMKDLLTYYEQNKKILPDHLTNFIYKNRIGFMPIVLLCGLLENNEKPYNKSIIMSKIKQIVDSILCFYDFKIREFKMKNVQDDDHIEHKVVEKIKELCILQETAKIDPILVEFILESRYFSTKYKELKASNQKLDLKDLKYSKHEIADISLNYSILLSKTLLSHDLPNLFNLIYVLKGPMKSYISSIIGSNLIDVKESRLKLIIKRFKNRFSNKKHVEQKNSYIRHRNIFYEILMQDYLNNS